MRQTTRLSYQHCIPYMSTQTEWHYTNMALWSLQVWSFKLPTFHKWAPKSQSKFWQWSTCVPSGTSFFTQPLKSDKYNSETELNFVVPISVLAEGWKGSNKSNMGEMLKKLDRQGVLLNFISRITWWWFLLGSRANAEHSDHIMLYKNGKP